MKKESKVKLIRYAFFAVAIIIGWIPALIAASLNFVYVWGMLVLAALNDGRINTGKLNGGER